MLRETEYSNYNRLLEQAREAGTSTARTWIPKLCQALREEDKNLSTEDIRDRVEKDCADIWTKGTIRVYIPDEFKDPQKQEAGKKGRQKQLEQPIPAGVAQENWAGNSSNSSTRQESESFESMKRPNVFDKSTYDRMQSDFQKRLEVEQKQREEIIKKKDDEIRRLREAHDLTDIPYTMVDDKVGVPKVQSLQRISDFDRRGFRALISRFGELVRRKLTGEGKATIKYYIISKDRTNNIEYLVPVAFTVDMLNRSTDLELDESRL